MAKEKIEGVRDKIATHPCFQKKTTRELAMT
jgi:hypothetical protein